MKSRYIIVGLMLAALTGSMLNGCGKKQEEETDTVAIVYESNAEKTSGETEDDGESADTGEEKDSAGQKEENQSGGGKENGDSTKEELPEGFPEDANQPIEDNLPTVSNIGLGANTAVVDNADTEEIELSIADESVLLLENMNFFVPLFEADAEHNEAFQQEILKYGFIDTFNGGEMATITDNSGKEMDAYKVSESVAAAYYKNLLGKELTIKPAKPENFGEETPVYYEDGNYYIGVMESQPNGYMYHRAYQKGDQVYVAFYMFDDTDTYSDYVFQIEWADNDNGFIVKAHFYDEQ